MEGSTCRGFFFPVMRTVMKFPCTAPQKLLFVLKNTFLLDSFDPPYEPLWFKAGPTTCILMRSRDKSLPSTTHFKRLSASL